MFAFTGFSNPMLSRISQLFACRRSAARSDFVHVRNIKYYAITFAHTTANSNVYTNADGPSRASIKYNNSTAANPNAKLTVIGNNSDINVNSHSKSMKHKRY